MNAELEPLHWKPASNGAGKMRWVLVRSSGKTRIMLTLTGNYRRFASREAAQAVADKANRGEYV